MPAPASDAIASDIGHGALGVRYGLRPFRDLLSETVGQRHLWVELRPKKLMASGSWTAAGGGVYWQALGVTFDGVVLPCVGVQTLTETLSHVEPGRTVAAGNWTWDGSYVWVHLTGDANPAATSVVAEVGVHVASHGVYQPILAADRLTNGTLEAWTGTVPDGWSHAEDAGVALDKTTSDPLQGSYSARFTFTAAAAAAGGVLYESFADLVAGQVYRVSGAYRVTCATAGALAAVLRVKDAGANYMLTDGRTAGGATDLFSDSAGQGEWKRFVFDFVAPSWAAVRILLVGVVVAGPVSGTVDFDDVKLQHVSRYAYHEPLLSVDSLPTIEAARADSFWGQMSSALGSMTVLNGGGYWEALLASLDWLVAQCIVRVGGRYQLGANEVLLDDCPMIATAKLGAPVVRDSSVTFDLTDDRSLLLRTLPLRTYNNNGGTDAYTQPDRGRSRPLLWGTKTGIRPVQYDINYYGGGPIPQGVYEIVDCTDWPTGVKELTQIYWYADEDAASARSQARRVSPPSLTYVSVDLAAGTFYPYFDCHPVIVDQDNNKLQFNIGGGTLTATLTPGTYAIAGTGGDQDIPSALQTALRAVESSAMNCFLSTTEAKIHITRNSGTLNLLCKTGDIPQTGLWGVIGFDCSSDKTGALDYTGSNTVLYQAYDQFVRIDAVGFKDDGSGTYTGTPAAAIEKAPDIARHILQAFLKVPASAIDVPSFVAARGTTWGAKPCSLYIGAPRTVGDVFAELETSGDFDLVLKGGVWYCLTRDALVPAGTPDLVDADYLSFEAFYEPEDLYGTVTLTYNEAPDGGDPVRADWHIQYVPHSRTEVGETTSAVLALRYGRSEQRTFKTCLRDTADATFPLAGSRLEEIAAEAQTKRRRFRFTVKGKCLQVPVNGKIRPSRTVGLDTTGALANVLVRVLRKRDDWARWVSDVEAIEVI